MPQWINRKKNEHSQEKKYTQDIFGYTKPEQKCQVLMSALFSFEVFLSIIFQNLIKKVEICMVLWFHHPIRIDLRLNLWHFFSFFMSPFHLFSIFIHFFFAFNSLFFQNLHFFPIFLFSNNIIFNFSPFIFKSWLSSVLFSPFCISFLSHPLFLQSFVTKQNLDIWSLR